MDGLLVIDVQQGLVRSPRAEPQGGDDALARIRSLVGQARRAGARVHFVFHDGGPGDPLDAGSPGFLSPPELRPRPSERVTIKTARDAFQDTDLQAVLEADGVDRLIVCGLQAEASILAAMARGYEVVLVEDSHISFDPPGSAERLSRRGGVCAVISAAAIRFS